MVKKLGKYKHDKEKRIAAQVLLQRGNSQKWVARELGISKQKISRWANNPIKERTRRTKLNEEYIDKIKKWQQIKQLVKWDLEKFCKFNKC